MNLIEQIVEAVVRGDEVESAALAEQVLEQGLNPVDAIQGGYSKAMEIVGDLFERMEYFLPDLMLSARAVNSGMQVLKPYLLKHGSQVRQGTVVLGTIQGDLHDVGKNIVKVMLQAAGFDVHDLGVDVSVRKFIEKAQEVDADIIGASGILTTTMAYMPDIVDLLTEMGIRDRFLVMLGGGPVTAEWAEKAGADGYGENATEAVKVAKHLMQQKQGGQ